MMSRLLQAFKLKVYESNGTSFQKLFEDVHQSFHGKEFQKIAPFGRYGDGGNDGWIKRDKHFFQVYAPNNFENKINNAISKMKSDFNHLYSTWGKVSTIKIFTLVINDKYSGCPSPLSMEMESMKKEFPSVDFQYMGASELELRFLWLIPEVQRIIVGNIYDEITPELAITIDIIERNLKLSQFNIINENFFAYALDYELSENIKDISNKLNYYKLPFEFLKLDEIIKNLVRHGLNLVLHYDGYEFCELIDNNIKKTKSWKREIIPQSDYEVLSNNDEMWVKEHDLLLNNFMHAINVYIAELRVIYTKEYMRGFFAQSDYGTTPVSYK